MTSDAPSRIEGRLRSLFSTVGARGWLHAVSLDDPAQEVSVGADDVVPLASVFKVALLVELFRRADDGHLDLSEPVTVESRTRGATGIAALRDPVRMSVRDLAQLMITVSDVGATDVLLERVGMDAVNETLRSHGLSRTRVRQTCAEMLASVQDDLGLPPGGDLARRLAQPGAIEGLRALDPRFGNVGTPRESTLLLGAIWNDEAATPESCAAMRAILGAQVWPHRLAAGFPSDEIAVAGKTGTLPTVRNEIGVVEFPDGRRFAIAVFTRSDNPALTLPQVDASIGAAARVAVEDIRRRSAVV